MTDRVVITAIGVASPLGDSFESFAEALIAERPAIAPITTFDARTFGATVAAEARLGDDDVTAVARDTAIDPLAIRIDRKTAFGVRAARQAVRSAFGDAPPGDIALSLGVGLEVLFLPDVVALYDRETRDIAASRLPLAGRQGALRLGLPKVTRAIASAARARVSVTTFVSACASGTAAIGEGALQVATGRARTVVAGATDSMVNPMGVGCFRLLGALAGRRTNDACRPFHRYRDGTVIGEGAAFVVLERLRDARARGARVIAEVLGYGSSLDAHRVTAPDPGGAGARAAMRRALASARSPRIGYVNAHGTGTPLNDAVEVAAIRAVLGDVPIAASKSAFGHAMAAAGALEIAATLLCFTHCVCPPTLHLDEIDPECAADHVTAPRRFGGDAALKNSFGFGGQNATLVIGGPP